MSLLNIILSNQDLSVLAVVPPRQLLDGSLQIKAPNKKFMDWSAQAHADSYLFMQRVAKAWNRSHLTDQYLIYGKVDSNPFNWEIVPYQKCYTFIGRAFQQLQVLWRTFFGGIAVSEKESKKQVRNYEVLLKGSPQKAEALRAAPKGNDAFCKADTIDRQWVITGKKVDVLFNYAPIGFSGERLHFLVVPKQHRETFTDVTKEEYSESLALTTKLVDHFTKKRKTIKNVYLMNKTGEDAGQSVKHWHLHVIFSTNTAQDFWGRITVIRNILFGSSPMKKEELAKKIRDLRKELATVKI